MAIIEIMHRDSLSDLMNWTRHPRRRPMVVRGARQVGKSHLVRMLAEGAFDDLLEINLEATPDAASLFESKDPEAIVRLLEARFGVAVRPGRTLVFLDEIQAAPEFLACLRYFFEKMPALHVVAAGSLLDFALADHAFAMPVGRISYLHLGPMTFEEFLVALGREKLREFIARFTPDQVVPDAIHHELLRLVKQYLIVGGMPASVEAWSAGGHRESDAIRQDLLSTYRDDFARYGGRAHRQRLEKLFAAIPRLVGRRFKYSQVDREERSRELKHALEMLCLARVAHRVRHTAANGIPLGAEADDRAFKVLFLDVGLLAKGCGLTAADVEGLEDPLLVNTGALCEQFVGQHLWHSGEVYDEPEAWCWIREKSPARAEVDYVIAMGPSVIPVEVKAGKTGTLKSLHVFLREKRRAFGLRFNADRPSLLDARTSLADGDNVPFRLLSLPLYLVGQTRRLCRWAIDR